METFIINRENIAELIEIDTLKEALMEGFKNYSNGTSRRDGQRIVLDISQGNKTTLLGPGTASGIPAYTIKANSKFPSEKIAIKGIIALFDIENGALLALLDSASITAIRTGLGAALATDCLSDPRAERISIIGAGRQNLLQLEYLLSLRSLKKAVIFDLDPQKARTFAKAFESSLECIVATSIPDCIRHTEMISMATWSKEPILDKSILQDHCHITSLGSDEKGKVEVSRDLVTTSKFYCDDIDLNMSMGTPGNLGLTKSCIHAEIGEVYLHPDKGRTTRNETTIYSCVGLPFQDLITAWHVYKKALTLGKVLRVNMH